MSGVTPLTPSKFSNDYSRVKILSLFYIFILTGFWGLYKIDIEVEWFSFRSKLSKGDNIKQTINQHQFEQSFRDCGRLGEDNDNFSYEALELLFNHFEGIENDTGEEIELDPIAICCEYAEMTKEELLDNYEITIHYPSLNTEEEQEDIVQRHLENNTSFVGKTASGFVFLQY